MAVAIMFLFTGTTHFSNMKHDYTAMLPAPLPKSFWIIYLTGASQIAGAIGLLLSRTRRISGIRLALFLVAMFPTNLSAALNEVEFRGEGPTPLCLRAPIQLFCIGVVWWVSIRISQTEQAVAR